jgi:O-antigen/teichoic acid export membrane protein
VGEALRFGGPVQLTNTLGTVHTQVDKLFLSRFVALAAVTSFELGSRIAVSVTGLPQLLLLPVMPETAALHAAAQSQRLRELYERASRYYLTGVAIAIAPVLAAGSRIYEVWLGAGHQEAALALRALTAAASASLMTGLATTMGRGVARPDLEARLGIVCVSLHVGLSIVLVQRLGMVGALIAIAVANLVFMLGFLGAFARLMHWPLLAGVLRPLGIPLLAIALGSLAGAGVDRLLPAGRGLWAWLGLGAVAGAACLSTLAVVLVTGFFHWREARALLFMRGSVARVPAP